MDITYGSGRKRRGSGRKRRGSGENEIEASLSENRCTGMNG